MVAVLLPWRKKSQRPVRAFKANKNRTHLIERHNEEQHRGQQAARKTTSLLPWEEESQRPVRALKSKYEVNNPWSTTDLGFTELVPLSHFGEALALSSRHLGSAEETGFKGMMERTKKR